jgi:CBS domain-containing protein
MIVAMEAAMGRRRFGVGGNAEHVSVPSGLTVAEVMTPKPLVLAEGESVRAAARVLFETRVGGAPVVDAAGRLVGVVSERDLLEKEAALHVAFRGAADADRRRGARTVGEICTRPARTTTLEATLHAVARRLIDERVARLVVVDDGRIVGIVTRHDVLRVLLRPDHELHAAVAELLLRVGVGDVHVGVQDGVVRVWGVVARRSQRPDVLGAVALVDGVVDVEDHLGWRSDDLSAHAPHPHP